MATRAIFTPFSAEFPTSSYPALTVVNTRPVLAFDADAAETCYWTFIVPQGITGTMYAVVHYFMNTATTGFIEFEASIEAITPDSDTHDLDTSDFFDTANASGQVTVPGTDSYAGDFSITLTTNDSLAAGDYVRLRLKRDATDGTNDTATGDCYVTAVEFRDAA